jgi:CBS domain-containing membrane protein
LSFFILIKNSVHKYDFPYLSGKEIKLVDDTLVGEGREKLYHFHKDHQGALVLARDLMSTNITYLSVSDKVSAAKKMMSQLNVHHAPVVRKNKIVGIISITDIHNMDEDILLQDEKLDNVMSNTVLCVSQDTPLQHILEVFIHEYVHCLPVVNEQQAICGIITQTDVFKWVLANEKYKK